MKKYNLIVVGGGLSGVAAAVSAKREGLSVLIIEREGSLGGALSHNAVYPFMDYTYVDEKGERKMLCAGIFEEMLKRHKALGGAETKKWQPEIFKIMLDEMVTEAGVDVLFHTAFIDVVKEDRKIKSLKVVAKNEAMEIVGDFFVDATGDGDLIYMSGCDCQLGRESDNLCQPMTTCFKLSGVDSEKYHQDRERLEKLYKEKQKSGEIKNPRENLLTFEGLGEGIVHFNTTRVIKHNPVDAFDLSRAEMTARSQVLEMYNFLKENSEAFKDSIIVSMASKIGVRESRKLKGEYILTAEDIKSLKMFDDSIALGNYPIDIHSPDGSGTYLHYFKPEEYYSVPYRSLLPKEFDNLLVAGRCLSAAHEAHSAVRIMPICTCMGEAAGTAIAVAVSTNTDCHTVSMKDVQQKLINNGAKIK